jgi:hypothetical protein
MRDIVGLKLSTQPLSRNGRKRGPEVLGTQRMAFRGWLDRFSRRRSPYGLDEAGASDGRFRLPLHLKQVGVAKHRSGWPLVIEHLRVFHSPNGAILLDDFVERTFRDDVMPSGWHEPWIGIFHHPLRMPEWLDPGASQKTLFSKDGFQKSLPFLRGAVALSEYVGNWLRQVLACPVLTLKHPTGMPEIRFSIERWEAQRERRIVQVGWYARNLRAIYQVEVPADFRKIHLLQDRIGEAIKRTDTCSPHRNRPWVGEVEVIRKLSAAKYDELIASSLILNEYWDVSASNTIVEAIARCTPLVVNRHPALEEYLGVDYPLFFDELADVRRMLNDRAVVQHAFRYLLEMDKGWLSVGSFARELVKFVHEVQAPSPE